ncbi:MAG: sensor histidine kinase, partial [Solirubrobacteraceae bacterium]
HQELELIVEADLDRLGQALSNMLDNALRYGRGAVSLFALAHERCLELHLVDQGPGFDAEFLPRAFERFSRQDPARSRGGAGLGLSIVRVIAQAHGGDAYVRTSPQGGADVWLTIPCA